MTHPDSDRRRFAPATLRNREAILGVLREVLPARGTVLEIASGTGEHAVYFAANLPGLVWQPTDLSAASRESIAAWIAHERAANVLPPLALDVEQEPWQTPPVDAILCVNMIHIAPWSACEALLLNAGRILSEGAVLCLYGPYKRGGAHTAESNARFDVDLRSRDARWGVRDLEAVMFEAALRGFVLDRAVEMPANNLTVVLRREAEREVGGT